MATEKTPAKPQPQIQKYILIDADDSVINIGTKETLLNTIEDSGYGEDEIDGMVAYAITSEKLPVKVKRILSF